MHLDLHCSSEAHYRNEKSITKLNPGSQENKKDQEFWKLENRGLRRKLVDFGKAAAGMDRGGKGRVGRGVAGWAGVWQG